MGGRGGIAGRLTLQYLINRKFSLPNFLISTANYICSIPGMVLAPYWTIGTAHINHKKYKIEYVPCDLVSNYTYIADLNTRICVGWKSLPTLKFKLEFQTQTRISKLNSSMSSRLIRYSGKFTPRVKVKKSMKQWVGTQANKWVDPGVGLRVFKIVATSVCFPLHHIRIKVIREKVNLSPQILEYSTPCMNFKTQNWI